MFVLSPVKHTPHIFCPYAPHIFYPCSPHLLPFRTFARAFARTFARTFARSPVRSLARPLARPLFARSYARPTPLVQYVQKCLKILISDFLNIANIYIYIHPSGVAIILRMFNTAKVGPATCAAKCKTHFDP